ncbi:MAG TPA: hypothetical protein VL051_05545 [Burkholderiaceae bacterium]|nr:hypothetical protein [Burkholderiaceae bacterium]
MSSDIQSALFRLNMGMCTLLVIGGEAAMKKSAIFTGQGIAAGADLRANGPAARDGLQRMV